MRCPQVARADAQTRPWTGAKVVAKNGERGGTASGRAMVKVGPFHCGTLAGKHIHNTLLTDSRPHGAAIRYLTVHR